ncbi:hypothetical protein H4582DRAFT_2036535 [Lactarius indigo]|nr:hypothetical protein H4582DRAFT_2036535 [Lactarius indigo]
MRAFFFFFGSIFILGCVKRVTDQSQQNRAVFKKHIQAEGAPESRMYLTETQRRVRSGRPLGPPRVQSQTEVEKGYICGVGTAS